MFTLEIAGRPVAIIGGEEEEARDIVESEAFQEDLRRLTDDSAPLWDGEAELSLRPATKEEIAEFESGMGDDEEDEDEDEDDSLEVMFLVPVSDPDEEDDED